jgi:hypothetical protein
VIRQTLLTGALASLAAYRQFIIYRLQPSASRPGKTDKFPCDHRTCAVANAHDAAIWTDAQTACDVAETLGNDWGVGFVFVETDPFFFIDLDECLQADNQWTPVAQQILAAFPGAAVEISHSGRGLHVFGTYSAIPAHGSKNTAFGLEFYHSGRFVALTGHDARGNASTNHDGALVWLTQSYFLPGPSATPSEWTDLHVPPEQDAELVARMFRSKSPAGVFGARASIQQLWEADSVALGRAYPDPGGTRPYDASSADAALAQHLAYWTRKDCERMRRMMWQSKLAREKWQREDYLPRTILKAVALQDAVLPPDKPAVQAALAHAVTSKVPEPESQPTDAYLTPAEQVEWFRGCVYVVTANKVLIPGGHMLTQAQFDVVYGGRAFGLDHTNSKTAKGAWDAFTHSQAVKFPRADAVCFRPELPPGELFDDAGYTLVNIYWPVTTPSEPGDVAPFLRHLEKLFPVESDRQIICAYLAALVQFPGDKFQWWPLIQGCEGNGKSLLLAVAEAAIGSRYCHRPNAADIGGNGGKFTAWLQGRLLIGIEEIKTSHRAEVLEILKPIITNSRIEIQGKGVDQVTGDNRANGLLLSNHKDAITKTAQDRRYAVFYTPQQEPAHVIRDGMGGNYFPHLYAWLRDGGYARVTYWLQTYQIPAELNPALNNGGACHRAPVTTSSDEAIALGMGRVEQEIMDAIGRGEPGFCGGWISSVMLAKLIRDISGNRGHLSPIKQREILRALGYDLHPSLINGRVNNIVSPDGKKPILYLKQGHIALNETRAAEIALMYSRAQPNPFNEAAGASEQR